MKHRYLFGLTLLVLTSCAVGPKYKRPDLKEPQAYTQSTEQTDSIANIKWWDVYQDSVLQTLIRSAVDSNLDLRQAIARVEESRAILGFNKANMMPFLDYNARARVSDFGATANEAGIAFPNSSIALLGSVSWEIGLFGKLRHANRAAYADMMANEETQKSIYISLVAEVAQLYFELRGLDERYAITQRSYESRMEYLRIITLRFERGEVSELDKLQAEQIAAAAHAQLFSLERAIIITENAINVLMGRSFNPISRGLQNEDQLMPVSIPSGLPSQLLERRPDIRAAEQQLIAQTERVGLAVALRFPSINLTGFLGVASPDISTLFEGDAYLGSITGQLTGPIFRFRQNKQRVEVERAITKQVAFDYEKTVLIAFAEVDNSLTEIRTYTNEFAARQTQVAATEKSLTLSKALYDNGYTSFLQVLDAERELLNAQYEKSIALQSQLISTVRLYKALGGGW